MFPVTCEDNPFIVAEQFLDPASNSGIHRHQRAWRSEKIFRLGCLVCRNIVMALKWCFQCNWSWSSKQLCQWFVGREASARQSKWKRNLCWKQRGHRKMCVVGQSLSHGVWNQIQILKVFARYQEVKYFCYLQKRSIPAPVGHLSVAFSLPSTSRDHTLGYCLVWSAELPVFQVQTEWTVFGNISGQHASRGTSKNSVWMQHYCFHHLYVICSGKLYSCKTCSCLWQIPFLPSPIMLLYNCCTGVSHSAVAHSSASLHSCSAVVF